MQIRLWPVLIRSPRRSRECLCALLSALLCCLLLPLAPRAVDREPFPASAAAPSGFLTYPFYWNPEMRLMAGWLYSDGTFHGAIDFVKGRPGNSNAWQQFDVVAAGPGDACWTPGGGKDAGLQVRIAHQIAEIQYETRYIHLARVESSLPRCPDKATIPRGLKIGVAGDGSWGRCAPPCVHLHFELRQAGKAIDPYDLYGLPTRYPQPRAKETGRMGSGQRWTLDPPVHPDQDDSAPVIRFSGPPRNMWYRTDEKLAWEIIDGPGTGVRGYNLAWDRDPGSLPINYNGDRGELTFAHAGTGVHTLLIRAWDYAGNEILSTLGWYGFDPTPPLNPVAASESHGVLTGVPQSAVNDPDFAWVGAEDIGCGITGYLVYWGTNASGTAANWTTDQHYDPGPVAPGTYYLRVSTQDGAGNSSAWKTLFVFTYNPS